MRRAALLLPLLAGLGAGCNEPRLELIGPWTNITANLAGKASACGDLALISPVPDQDQVLAGVAEQGLWTLSASTSQWTPLGQASGSDTVTNAVTCVVYDPGHPGTFWESGIHIGAGVYRTTDGGQTFTQLGALTNNDLVAIDWTDPLRRTLLAGVHESGQHLMRSVDGGSTWSDLGPNLPATAGDTSWPLVLDSQNYLVGTALGRASGIFRSTDGGASWTRVFTTGVRSHPLLASDGAIYWMLDGNSGVAASSDQGVTWSTIVGAGQLTTIFTGMLELPDGRLAAPGQQFLMTSSDKGRSWKPIAALPYVPFGLAYSKTRKAFYAWRSNCDAVGDVVAGDAVTTLPFDYLAR